MKVVKILIIIQFIVGINHINAAAPVVVKIRTVQEFNNTLANNDMVVAEYYSPDCPHCRNFERAGIFDGIATTMPNVRCITISSNLIDLHRKAGITAYPTFVVYKNGKKVGTRIGFQHREPLKRFITESTTH